MTSHFDPLPPLPGDSTTGLARFWRKRRTKLVFVLLLLVAAGTVWYGSSGPDNAATTANRQDGDSSRLTNAGLPAVSVVAVRQDKFDDYLSALGTVTPLETAIIRPRVDGQITRIAFREGQLVKAGDLLAQIDPQPFEVQLELAAGQLARDQALLDNARADLERYRTLLAQDSISSQLVDTQESLVRQYQAAVQTSQGRLDNAKLQLAYTRVTAPIDGRVGLRQASPGNFVRTADANGIAVITQLQPVGAVFAIPEDALPRVMKRLRNNRHIPVDAYDRAGKERLAKGRLLAVDNQIDSATGTIRLKAEFPNTDSALFANQFVNVKMLIETRPDVMLIPTAALQRGTAGTFVYIVKKDRVVGVAPVKTGPAQGEMTLVENGVSVGDLVVVEGADRLRDGVKVELIGHSPPVGSN